MKIHRPSGFAGFFPRMEHGYRLRCDRVARLKKDLMELAGVGG